MLFLVALLALTVVSTCTGVNEREKRDIPSDPLPTCARFREQEQLLEVLRNLVIEKFNSLNVRIDNEVTEKIARLTSQFQHVEAELRTVNEKIASSHQNMTGLGNQLNCIETSLKPFTCPSGYVRGCNFSGCYKFSTIVTNYDDARTLCERDGAHLLAVESATEMNLLIELMDRVNATHGFYRTGAKQVGGSWKWEGVNTPFTYANWYPGFPDSTECMEIYYVPGHMDNTKWGSYVCTTPYHYICEI